MPRHITATLCALVILFLSMPASAFVVTTSAGTYDVTTISTSSFNLILNGQVWWGNSALAAEFATEVDDNLGLFTQFGGTFLYGPLFLHSRSTSFINFAYRRPDGTISENGGNGAGIYEIAVATEVTTGLPEPGTLGLSLAGLAGIAISRKRKLQ